MECSERNLLSLLVAGEPLFVDFCKRNFPVPVDCVHQPYQVIDFVFSHALLFLKADSILIQINFATMLINGIVKLNLCNNISKSKSYAQVK